MNEVFSSLLRKYVLVFFDDILVSSNSWEEHLQHLHQVFSVIRSNHLVLNQSKCSMGTSEVAYLGHIISTIGVKVEHSNIQVVTDWPPPTSITALRGFLGLAGYYRKFIRRYGQIVAPLNNLLKKNAFTWLETAAHSFQQLKEPISSAPVLQLPDFDESFVVECDASGAVLVLKYLLEQRLTTSPQQYWLIKLMGFDFTVEYKPRSLNVGANALSRWDIPKPQLHAISQPRALLLDSIREEAQQYLKIIALCHEI
ncbi:uncharacterized mitochondrial protein AtMg00860-like [Aristolochia californica]|uniref:uncharacterized mitochondrial protein AtMg00860-like n=1 Tax=Aristolochia californica TaxID=171875 RepID=UPI0035E08C26